ncbi:hypothetical protein SNE40_012370 [Patella caerulea]|uniref:Uncharacterized protein n=1 Tax=Patella caerulea TaxID=87958 RepID=A0AAN8JP97_PATCE
MSSPRPKIMHMASAQGTPKLGKMCRLSSVEADDENSVEQISGYDKNFDSVSIQTVGSEEHSVFSTDGDKEGELSIDNFDEPQHLWAHRHWSPSRRTSRSLTESKQDSDDTERVPLIRKRLILAKITRRSWPISSSLSQNR